MNSVTCIGASANEQIINSLLSMGGAGTVVYLCPSVTISLRNPIQFTAANQTIVTRGQPTDSTRATLLVTGATQTNAITGSCAACSGVQLRNIQVNGNRPALGFISGSAGGSALLEMGGTNQGQIIDNVKAYEPRSWSTLHGIEGTSNSCSGMTITNNQLGPAGQGPSGTQQTRFSKRASYVPTGQWADGISLACQKSYVSGNTITDATDGAIVVFGAPGSSIVGNTIISATRNLMGGVNAVDINPWAGSFAGTVVSGNTINSKSAMIKVGLPIGSMVWGSNNSTSQRTSNGTWTGNTLTSGATGYFGYGIAIGGHNSASVYENTFVNANFAGVVSGSCTNPPPPTPAPLYFDPTTSPGRVIESDFAPTSICYLICMGPTTTMTTTGYNSSPSAANAIMPSTS
ncbi:hypothetical protein T439DRAFT_300725 [Meredithblackwellia eburnea MCA 4105]